MGGLLVSKAKGDKMFQDIVDTPFDDILKELCYSL